MSIRGDALCGFRSDRGRTVPSFTHARYVPSMDDTKRAAFRGYLRAQFHRAGYDLDQRGEQARLVRESGLPQASLSRLLAASADPEIRSLQQIAEFLQRPLAEVLIEAGYLTHDEIDRVRTRRPAVEPLTTDQALDELKITDPGDRSVVSAVINTVRQNRAKGADGAERAAE